MIDGAPRRILGTGRAGEIARARSASVRADGDEQGKSRLMAITALPRTERPDGVEDGPGAPDGRAFLRWGTAAYGASVALVVVALLWWLDGHLVYVLDDAAIHLSVADRLAHDGTWGVVPGHFESASSSPLWTVLVSAGLLVAGPAAQWVPLALNVVAGLAVVAVLASGQTALVPCRRRPADAAATVVLVTVVLFLPGLVVVGMEHTLHVALVLAAVVGVHRWALHQPGPAPGVTYALVALAALTRIETAFVAAGLATALVVVDRRAHGRRAMGLLAAAGLPVVALGLVNRALGGGWLPNSILAKGQGTGQAQRDGLGPVDVANRLTHDPVLALLVGVALVYLLVRGRRSPGVVPAVTLVVGASLHAVLADVGWYERYQAYLIAIGVYLLLGILTEVPREARARAVAAVCVLGLVFGVTKVGLLVRAPIAADDMYRHQYQAGRFLDRYYDGQPVATDQLGYVSYLHDGPLTDLGGLGDYRVLRERGDRPSDELWTDLTAERRFRVVVLYDASAAFRVPREWIMAGQWVIDGDPVSGVSRRLQFFATVTDEVEPLQDHLRAFEDDLPDRTRLRINENAGLEAMAQDLEAAAGATSGQPTGAPAPG